MTHRFPRIILALILVLSLCVPALAEMDLSELNYDDYFTSRDLSGKWDPDAAVELDLTGDLTITEPGVYVLSGVVADGTVRINVGSDEKVQLVLNGVSISCSDNACIIIENADKAYITLAEGTENTLTSTGFTADEEVNAVVYSKDDVVFNGTGSLTIHSAAHGIVSKDDIKFGNGNYVIHAVKRGISGNDSVRVFDGSYTIYSGKDPLRTKRGEDEEKGYILIWGGHFYLYNTGDEE